MKSTFNLIKSLIKLTKAEIVVISKDEKGNETDDKSISEQTKTIMENEEKVEKQTELIKDSKVVKKEVKQIKKTENKATKPKLTSSELYTAHYRWWSTKCVDEQLCIIRESCQLMDMYEEYKRMNDCECIAVHIATVAAAEGRFYPRYNEDQIRERLKI